MTNEKPYSRLTILLKYLLYYFSSKGKHSVHSPLVFDFINQVLNDAHNAINPSAEHERKRLESSQKTIDFIDFGKSGKTFKKKIRSIAKNSLKSKKYAQLLGKIVQYYKTKKIIELGTSLGVTTSYLSYDKTAMVTTMEGSEQLAQEAQNVWNNLKLSQIKCITGDFNLTLNEVAKQSFDLVYIDGNHRCKPTLAYFYTLKKNSHEKTIFIFDDIHYSPSMEKAWKQIKNQPEVSITIDLFFLGIVWIDPSLSKENFVLRY